MPKGGARKGAGRPKGSGIERTRMWVPAKYKETIKKLVKQWLSTEMGK